MKEALKEGEKFVDVWKSKVEKTSSDKKMDEALMRHSKNQVISNNDDKPIS